MEDSRIIDLFFERNESAITQTEEKYGRYCRFIACRILHSDFDADETVNDTYLKIWNTVPPNRPQKLKAYAGMICRQLALDKYEANHAKKRSGEMTLIFEELEECIPDGTNGTDIGESMALKEALDKFLAALPEKTRIIFLRRYWYAMPLSEIAKSVSEKESSLAVLMLRTRKKLKKFLKEEGFEI